MCSLIDNLVSMPPDKKVQLLPQERKILVKGLDDIFETLCEYKNRCEELYIGNGNANSDEIILKIEPEEKEDNEDNNYVEDEYNNYEEDEDENTDDEYCEGCEAGADCAGAHTNKCNMSRGLSSFNPF
tara:strand:+ start:90 stop:473 length:384 start_codon:yes stop_codon:yes gene_type:complete